jgi:tetratricopeptide (TPR) repeat protein
MVFPITPIKKITTVLILAGLTACASIDPYTQPSGAGDESTKPVIDSKDTNQQVDKELQAPKLAPAAKPKAINEVATAPAVVKNLLSKANIQQRQGDLNAAMSTVERAIRIAPRYPDSYYQLAELKFEANDFSSAKSLAEKSISLGASGNVKRDAVALVDKSDSYLM